MSAHKKPDGYSEEDMNEVLDSPELSAEDFARAKPFAEVFPHLANRLPTRGPQKTPTKRAISIRLDAEVIDRLRGGGAGWQTRANDLLRKALRLKG